MGFFDIFKSKPSKNAILAQVRKAKEIYAQPEYRRMAMEKLLKWNTEESLKGLLERFCTVVQSPHWDEDEKRWLVDELVKLGDQAAPILKEFILTKNDINYALIAYQQISSGPEAYRKLLLEALRSRPPSDHRSVQGKQELIAAIGELEHDDEFDQALIPYLSDHSDDVQCAAIDALAKSSSEDVKEKLIELLQSEVHSARVLRTAANHISNLKLKVGENIKLTDAVQEDFRVEEGYLVRLNR